MQLLDPKTDAVFKMLFARPENGRLLISLIEAVLRPPSPIRTATVLNPEIPKELVGDRGVVLDVLVELADGARVNLEMQRDPRGALGQRWLYGWARLFSEGIKRGDSFSELTRVVCIAFLDTHPQRRFHQRFRVLETETGRCFSDALEIHLIELPEVDNASREAEALIRWARFLRVRSERELQSIARGDDVMTEAKQALERLSEDPEARYIAEKRRDGQIYLHLMVDHARKEGQAEGQAEGRAEGQAEGLRIATRAACKLLGVDLDAAKEAELATASVAQLQAIHAHLLVHRQWP